MNLLLENYTQQVKLHWPAKLAGKQRVWFAVYSPADERKLRARLPLFETATRESGHGWISVDLTPLLPTWISQHEYREGIFECPENLSANDELEIMAAEKIEAACASEDADSNSVVAVVGLASLFDFMRVSSLIDRLEDKVRGRLLVFFPGEHRQNVYRFMEARDGFNYMAIPITSTESFLP